MEPGKVQCVTCGLLTVRPSNSQDLVEAIDADRDGEFHGNASVSRSLRCFVGADSFAVPLRHPNAGPDDKRLVLNVIGAERECPKHIPYWQGFTAKERVQMRMLEEQREWQAKESLAAEERARAWEAKQAESGRIESRKLAAFGVFVAAIGYLFGKVVEPWITANFVR